MGRKQAIKCHAGNRAKERLGYWPNDLILRQIGRLIRRRLKRPPHMPLNDVKIERQRNGRVIAVIHLDGIKYKVVYETVTKLIVTFLPTEPTGE